MFKNRLPLFFVLFLLLFFSANAFASVTMLLPVEAELSNASEITLGSLAKGETLEITLKKNSGQGFDWSSVSVSAPKDWDIVSLQGDRTISVKISVPENAEESIQLIGLSLASEEQPLAEESFTAIVTVKSNLLSLAINDLKQEAFVGEPISYVLVANNDSIAYHRILVGSSLPNYWFEPMSIELKPYEKKETAITVVPKAYGLRNFSFIVSSSENSFSQEFFSELRIKPTVQGKFLASAYAFPFYSLSNLAFYALGSIFAMPFS